MNRNANTVAVKAGVSARAKTRGRAAGLGIPRFL